MVSSLLSQLSSSIRHKCLHHGENGPIAVCKLVAEESVKSVVLDTTLADGLWGVVTTASYGRGRG